MSNLLEKYPPLLSISDVAEILGISCNTARKLVKNNSLPTVKIGNRFKVTKNKLLRYLGENEDSYSTFTTQKEMTI